MSKPIAVGDLVQIVKPSPCCNSSTAVGHTFVVNRIDSSPSMCKHCGENIFGASAVKPNGYWTLLSRLKRIPPLSELEGQRTEENLKEPA